MRDLRLRAVSRTSGTNAALKDGDVTPEGVRLDFEEVPVLVHAFRRMVRSLEWDVCEMAFTTYLCARAHGVAFTALPVFLVRGLHHGAIVQSRRAPLSCPRDLEGRRVGVGRGWTVTTGVWARGILAEEHGVDLDAVTWVRSGDEHVEAYRPPPNVSTLGENEDLARLLVDGAIAAGVNMKVDDPDVIPLLSDPDEAAYRALEERRLYPINHLVVVRDEVLTSHPDVGPSLFNAFAEAKAAYVARLRTDEIVDATETDRMYQRVAAITGDDPLPYGVDRNREMIERLVDFAVAQHVLDERPDVEQIFAPGTRALTA